MLLPAKSTAVYQKYFEDLLDFCKLKNVPKGYLSENILLSYFSSLTDRYQPSSLFTRYSAIKAVSSSLGYHLNFDHVLYMCKLCAKGSQPKKSAVLTRSEVNNFLRNAPDNTENLLCRLCLPLELVAHCGVVNSPISFSLTLPEKTIV